MKTIIKTVDKEDFEKWEITFENGEISIFRDGFENGCGVYRGNFECDKAKELYKAMSEYYENI